MRRETYVEARRRILAHLLLQGWSVKPTLKVPQAWKSGVATLYFHPQAVYFNHHSLFIDIRRMSETDFDATIERRLESIRRDQS